MFYNDSKATTSTISPDTYYIIRSSEACSFLIEDIGFKKDKKSMV